MAPFDTPLNPARTRGIILTALLAVCVASSPAGAQTNPGDTPGRLAGERNSPGAISLSEMVGYALSNYPSIRIAQSERNVARFDVKRARGKHYPTVSVAGSRKLDGSVTGSLGPRLSLNLYASGAINAEIEREQWREKSLASTETERREDITFDVVQAYFRLLGANRLHASTARSLERHRQLVEDFREIARIDKGRRFDLIQARARAEQVRFQLAERSTEIALAKEALSRFYPLPFASDALTEPPDRGEPEARNAAGQQALAAQHPTVLAAEHQLMAARANLKVARGNRGPRVDVESQTGANRFSQLTLSWPAFDLAASAAQDSADAALAGASASVDEQRRLVLETQRTAVAAWRTAQDRAQIAASQISIAEQVVQVYREQFGIGRRNLLDLLNAYTELANAEAAAQTSQIDAALARHQIEYASGRLSLLFVNPE